MMRMQVFLTDDEKEVVMTLYRNAKNGKRELNIGGEGIGFIIKFSPEYEQTGLATRAILAVNVLGINFVDEQERFLAIATLDAMLGNDEIEYQKAIETLIFNDRYRKQCLT